MSQVKVRVPDFSNATPGFLADELGRIREQKKELEKLEGLHKSALMARLDLGQTTVQGEEFSVLIEDRSRASIDGDRVKSEMGEEWWSERCKVTNYKQVNTARNQKE